MTLETEFGLVDFEYVAKKSQEDFVFLEQITADVSPLIGKGYAVIGFVRKQALGLKLVSHFSCRRRRPIQFPGHGTR
ncbi:hypothetical protein [Halostagnicola bangensis]